MLAQYVAQLDEELDECQKRVQQARAEGEELAVHRLVGEMLGLMRARLIAERYRRHKPLAARPSKARVRAGGH